MSSYTWSLLFFSRPHHFVCCGGASLSAVDSEPEWLLREWRPLFIYNGTQAPGRQDSRQARQDKRKSSWASCSLSVSLILCFPIAFSFIIPAALALSAKSDFSSWIQFSADAAFSRMERLKRRFPMLEPAFLADVLTTSQEGESRPYKRIEIEMQGYVCVCPCCQSEVFSELLEVIGDPKPLPAEGSQHRSAADDIFQRLVTALLSHNLASCTLLRCILVRLLPKYLALPLFT